MKESSRQKHHHVCPVWVGYFLASPIRALFQNPKRILAPHVAPGMSALDIGCAMGFFSLPLARLVGANGRVVCVDLQQKMLDALMRRARSKGLHEQLDPRLCGSDSLGIDDLNGRLDFALAFAVVHEVPDSSRLFSAVGAALKSGSRLLVAEPKGRVRAEEFRVSIETAEACGFHQVESPTIPRSHAVLLERK